MDEGKMLRDIVNGPDWILWVVVALFAVLCVVLLSGHGEGLVAGYNTASPEEKEKYDGKKLCRVVGGGMAVLALMLLLMAVGLDCLPSSFVFVFLAVTFVDCILMITLAATICRK